MNALVMAGGSGSRFWPLSRRCRPKQFLSLGGDKTLLEQTFARLEPIVGKGGMFIVTGVEYSEITRSYAPRLPPENLILEPYGRNTAACIGLSSIVLEGRGMGGEVVVVCPADHVIGEGSRFEDILEEAEKVAAGGWLVVLGIPPVEPSPHYGYIEKNEPFTGLPGVHTVRRFVEKPSRERAEQMLEQGEYFWNAGIFLWTPESILEAIEKHMPGLFSGLERIRGALDKHESLKVVEEVYRSIPSIPIDIGVLERTDKLAMVEAELDWCDVGSWSTLRTMLESDSNGNCHLGPSVTLNSSHNLLWSSSKLIAAVGVEGIAIVETEDAVLVCSLDRDQEIKELMELLNEKGYGDLC